MTKTLSIIITLLILLTAAVVPAIAADNSVTVESQRIKANELKALLDKGETVLFVDVRSSNEFMEMHITGALSVPLHQVETKLAGLSLDTKIAFY